MKKKNTGKIESDVSATPPVNREFRLLRFLAGPVTGINHGDFGRVVSCSHARWIIIAPDMKVAQVKASRLAYNDLHALSDVWVQCIGVYIPESLADGVAAHR